MKAFEKAPLLLCVLAIALAPPAASQPDFMQNPLSAASQFLSGLLGGGSMPNIPTVPGIPLAGLPAGMMDPSHALVESAPVLPGDGAAAPVAAQASGAMTPLEAPVASPPAAGPAALAPSPAGMEGHGHGESMHEPHSEATHDLSHVVATAHQIAEEVHQRIAEEAGALRAALRQRLATGAPTRRMLRSADWGAWDSSSGGSSEWGSSSMPADTWAGHASRHSAPADLAPPATDTSPDRTPSGNSSSSGGDGGAAAAPQQASAGGSDGAGVQGDPTAGVTGMEAQLVETADLLFSLLTGAAGLGGSMPDRSGMHAAEPVPAAPAIDAQASEGEGHHAHGHDDGKHDWAHPRMPRHKPGHWDSSAWAAAAPGAWWATAGHRHRHGIMDSMHPDPAWMPADGPAAGPMTEHMHRHHHPGKHHTHAGGLAWAPAGSPAAGPVPDMPWVAAAAPDVPAWSWPPAVDGAAPAP